MGDAIVFIYALIGVVVGTTWPLWAAIAIWGN